MRKHWVLAILFAAAAIAGAQNPEGCRQNRALDGSPLNPLADFAKRAECEAADKRFKELKENAAEMADLSRQVSEEIEKNGRDVVSARIFERLDRIEKLVKKVRSGAKD
jgi:hypothetical protein